MTRRNRIRLERSTRRKGKGVPSGVAALASLTLVALAAAISLVSGVAPGSAGGGPVEVRWRVETLARGLTIPWALAISPDGQIFFSERPGRVSVIERTGDRPKVLADIADVARSTDPSFATGLLGLDLDPDFPQQPYLYVYYSYFEQTAVLNRLVRFRLTEQGAVEDKVLLDRVPGTSWQNGGRLAFGPDHRLYLTTGGGQGGAQVYSTTPGDLEKVFAVNPHGDRAAQDLTSLACKILRLERDGSTPADNPFPGSPVWSYGHRNPQGLAWSPLSGKLYETEHGPPGGWDEINQVERGGNYGWPRFKGNTAMLKPSLSFFSPQRYRKPVAVYTPSEAPSGLAVYSGRVFPQWRGDLLVATLGGEHLHRLKLAADGKTVLEESRLLDGAYGRLRDVVEGPDGLIYISTSNRDQAGTPTAEDDRILRLVPDG
jgi:glucose/arabinose dehydrogenase